MKITYSLRYQTAGQWHKVNLQWCTEHGAVPTDKCIEGLKQMKEVT